MTRFECIDWYDTRRYYDIVFDAGTPVECDFLESMKRNYELSRGCGTAVTFPAMTVREEW